MFRIAHEQTAKQRAGFRDCSTDLPLLRQYVPVEMVGEEESQITNTENQGNNLPCQRYGLLRRRRRFRVRMRVRERGGTTYLKMASNGEAPGFLLSCTRKDTKNLFSKDYARSRLMPFCAKRTVSIYASFVVGRLN